MARRVIGAAIEVHRHLGPGYPESVYEDALAVEFGHRSIPFERQKRIFIEYKGQQVGEGWLDFLVDRMLVVELKAVETINELFVAQVLSYLKATELQLRLLTNFNVPVLRDGVKRVVRS